MKTNQKLLKWPLRLLVATMFIINIYNASATTTDWTGAMNTAWSNPLNWTAGVPTASVDAVIDPTYYTGSNDPTLDATGLVANSLTINGSATLNGASSTDLTVSGILTGTGTLAAGASTITISGDMVVDVFNAGTSSIVLNGSSTQSIDAYTFYNLEVDNSSVSLASTEVIEGDLTGSADLAGGSGGSLTVYGNMSVSSYSASTSTVYLLGSSNQNISQAYTFYNLTLDNSAGATLTGGNLSIANNLTLTAGILALGTNDLIITPTTGGLSGTFSASNYIETNSSGILRMSATSGGAIYPVGDDYNPITIADAGAHVFDVGVSDAVTDGNNNPVTDWSVNRTWTVTSPSSATITVTTQWTEPTDLTSGGHYDNTDAFIAYRDVSNTFTWTPMTSSDISAQSNPYTLTSPSTISTTGGDIYDFGVGLGSASALPVSLVSFTAQYQDNHVNLNWATASEQNNAYFDVERSLDATNWTSVGQVQGHGTSDVYNNYVDVDNLQGVIPSGTFYYRLKQVDFNGNFIYSMIRSVDISSSPSAISAYPNPTNNILNISWASNSEDNTILRLINTVGTTVYEQTVRGMGIIQKQVDMTGLADGVYYLQIMSANGGIINQAVNKN